MSCVLMKPQDNWGIRQFRTYDLPRESSALLTLTHKGFHGPSKTFLDLVQSLSHIRLFCILPYPNT